MQFSPKQLLMACTASGVIARVAVTERGVLVVVALAFGYLLGKRLNSRTAPLMFEVAWAAAILCAMAWMVFFGGGVTTFRRGGGSFTVPAFGTGVPPDVLWLLVASSWVAGMVARQCVATFGAVVRWTTGACVENRQLGRA